MLQGVDFKAINDATERAHWRKYLDNLFARLRQVESLVLYVVSSASPEGYTSAETLPEFDGDGDDDIGDGVGMDDTDQASGGNFVSPRGQLLSVCAWLSIKEVALLLGSIVTNVPMPLYKQEEVTDNLINLYIDYNLLALYMQVFLTEAAVEAAGDQFLKILMQARHRGAMEKAYMGFQASISLQLPHRACVVGVVNNLTYLVSRCYARTCLYPVTHPCIPCLLNGSMYALPILCYC